MKKIKNINKNLRLVMSESAITAGLLSMSIMSPFFYSIGLNNEQIALTQIIFTIVVMIFNIPTGYIADRMSRKWANIIGDLGSALILLCYAFTENFVGVVICESLLGITMALSAGVDSSLLKHFSGKLAKETGESENKILKKKTATLEIARYACNFVLLLLGGPIGAISLRLAIALSCVNIALGGIISIFIDDDSEKLIPKHKNPLKDMAVVTKEALKNKPLRWRIFAYAVGREMTHGIIWVATPLMLQAGVPLWLVSIAWALNSVTCIIGAALAARYGQHLSDRKIMLIPLLLMTISMGVMSINLNIVTVWFYTLMGVVQGWTGATLMPIVQRYVKPSEQTSVLSLTKAAASLLYIPAVWAIGRVADINLEYGLLATLVIFVPLSLIVIKNLKEC